MASFRLSAALRQRGLAFWESAAGKLANRAALTRCAVQASAGTLERRMTLVRRTRVAGMPAQMGLGHRFGRLAQSGRSFGTDAGHREHKCKSIRRGYFDFIASPQKAGRPAGRPTDQTSIRLAGRWGLSRTPASTPRCEYGDARLPVLRIMAALATQRGSAPQAQRRAD
jgi:hypothetical protein